MTDDVWDLDTLDLSAYLRRVGVPQRAPSHAALDELLAAHAMTFTFDNIDVVLDQHPGVSLGAVQEKFVGRGRGGYCFEHATLVGAVLARTGYAVRPVLARVGDPWTTGRTHLELVVTLPDSTVWLADPGIGRSPLGAIPLQDNATHEAQGWRHQLRRVTDPEPGWALARDHHGEWEHMHTSDDGVVRPVDVRVGHHYTSTFPGSHFSTTVTVGRHSPGQHTTVSVADGACSVTTRRPGAPTQLQQVSVSEAVQAAAALTTGLTREEVVRLEAVANAFVSRGPLPPAE